MSEWKEADFGIIPIDWDLKKIIELKGNEKSAIAMGPFGSNIKADNFVPSGVPVIRGKNLNYFKYVDGDFVFLTEEKADELLGSNCKPGDLVFTHRGTIGQVGLIPNNKYNRYVISQSGMKLTVDSKLVDNEFLFYFFISEYGQYQLLKYESQVGVPSISNPLTSLKEIEVPIPTPPEQKAIASVLSSLDDKIDLLHRQNKTLEAMEEILFRQWFVDSDELNVNNEKFGNVVQFIKGKKPKNTFEVFIDGLVPQILIETFDTGKTLFSEPENMVIANQKDILMVMDGASSGRVEIGFIGIVGSTIGLFKPVDNFNFPLFLFHFLKSNEDVIKDNTTGSAIPHTDKALVLDLDFKYLNINKVKEFEQIAYTWFQKKLTNRKQIYTLEKLRGNMLPKLMSGEVRVKYEKN